MPFVSARDYETVMQVDTFVSSGRRKRVAKVLAGLVAGVALCVVSAAVVRARPRPGLTPLDKSDVVLEFTASQFPQDCNKMMQYVGCKKKAWACEQDDGTVAYKCCCDDSIWQVPAAPLPARILGDSMLRLERTQDVCLGAEESAGGFRFAPCGKSNTRFRLPPRGAGPVKLATNPKMCLGVESGSTEDVQLVPCNGGQDQVFQLTKGTQGMLQWSQTGTRCLDSEDASTQKGSKIMLKDCNFWPVKPSQVFVVEEAPKTAMDTRERIQPSLFCTSLMLPWSYEVNMLRSHLAHGTVGIFGCDDWAVYSNKKVKLREASHGQEELFCDVMNGTLRAKIGGEFHTALNTPIFRRFWARIVEDPRSWKNDWIAKLDPDAVFFADRLKEMLRNQWPGGIAPGAAWLNNCQLGLHGPIEVFNQKALSVYKEKSDDCEEVARKHRQEDVYLAHCFAALGVEKVDAFNLLLESEWACNERPSSRDNRPPCFDRQVSFHPFKSVTSYFNCYDRAKKMSWALPLRIVSEEPGPQNHHHA